jgi:hypothetical protein
MYYHSLCHKKIPSKSVLCKSYDMLLIISVPGKGKCKPTDMEKMLPLLKLVLYCVDKISRLQLGKEVSISNLKLLFTTRKGGQY